MKNFTIIIFLILSFQLSKAQQDAMFTHYMDNTLAINPAYAGNRDCLSVLALHRSQWVGFDGAPNTQTIVGHMPFLDKNMGIGVSLINDHIGPSNMFSFYTDFSYKIKVAEGLNLAFGLKSGFNWYNGDIKPGDLDNMDDNIFTPSVENKFMPNMGTGVYLFADNYYVGLSTPKVFTNNYSKREISTDMGGEKRHFYIIGGYAWELDDDFTIKPTSFLKITGGAPLEMDMSARVVYQEDMWAGLMFRTGESVGLFLGMNVYEELDIGYSFDWSVSSRTGKYNGGSHEVMLRYDFDFAKRSGNDKPHYF